MAEEIPQSELEDRAGSDAALTISQIVAYNLYRLRKPRPDMPPLFTQKELAVLMNELVGKRWTEHTVSESEIARFGKGRQLTPEEIVALAYIFNVPPLLFFVPPEGSNVTFTAERGDYGPAWMTRTQYGKDVLMMPGLPGTETMTKQLRDFYVGFALSPEDQEDGLQSNYWMLKERAERKISKGNDDGVDS